MASFGGLKEGWMLQQSTGKFKSWKKRYFVLQSNVLYYFKKESDKEASGYISMGEITKVEDRPGANKPNMIAINTAQKTYLCSAETLQDASDWVQALRVLVRMSGYRNAFVDNASAWGVSEPFLKKTMDHCKKAVENLVVLMAQYKGFNAQCKDKSKSDVIIAKYRSIGGEAVTFCALLVDVIHTPFSLDRRAELFSVSAKLSGSCDSLAELARGTADEPAIFTQVGKVKTELAALMALEVPMPLIEIDWAMNKIIVTLQEYEQNNAVRADEAEKMAQKFVGSCEMDKALYLRLAEKARLTPKLVDAVCKALKSQAQFGNTQSTALTGSKGDLHKLFGEIKTALDTAPF